MELSQFTDFSLRALIYVAVKGEQASVREIAEAYGISQHHLVKVVHRLARHGYVTTTRGRGGGVNLARNPEEIGVGEVVRVMEGLGLVECFPERGGSCVIDGVCVLKHALGRAKAAFLAELDRMTLADLTAARRPLRRQFGFDAGEADSPPVASGPAPILTGKSRPPSVDPSESRESK